VVVDEQCGVWRVGVEQPSQARHDDGEVLVLKRAFRMHGRESAGQEEPVLLAHRYVERGGEPQDHRRGRL
jgi:hypothetical protein